MKNTMFFRVLVGSLFLALLFSATLPVPAFADEGVPPADPVPTEEAGVVGENASMSGESAAAAAGQTDPSGELAIPTSADEPLPATERTELGVLDIDSNFDLASADPSTGDMENLSVEDLAAEGAESTGAIEIVVTDESGESLPLASEAASEILTTGDPIWCPASVTVPKPGVGGCTTSFDNLADLFAELTAHPKTVDGTIWIEKDYNSTMDATLDGGSPSLATMRNFKLTLKGGWNGCGANPPVTCLGTLDTLNPSEINHQVSFLAWNNDVTLSDLLITSVADSGDALVITTTGKIVVTRVTVSENEGAGASLDNTAGTKDVYIAASTFNKNNGGDGLDISSRGLITLKDVTATTNGADGANLNNAASPSMLSVTLLGTNIFSENMDSGLVITSSGPISASNLVNNANGNYGAQLDNTAATKANGVALSGSNQFKFNGAGLSILSDGAITLNNVNASNNGSLYGASFDNSNSTFGSNITLTGINYFNENQQDGLLIASAGAITISKTTANSNGQGGVSGYGAKLVNTAANSAKPVVINASVFNSNFEGGLFGSSDGAIAISSLMANGNGGNGAELTNLTANPAAPQNVALTGSVGASLNGSTGLEVQSLGAITLAFLTASGNQAEGVILDNSLGLYPRLITITGNNQISENHAVGLVVSSKGAITLNNVSVLGNLGPGADLDNDMEGALGAVTISGINTFSGNSGSGLDVATRGNILITNIKAIANSGAGAVLNNAVTGFQGTVSLGSALANWCNEFSENDASGLEISSNGTVTLTNVCASKNGNLISPGYGAVISNGTATLPKTVILKGINAFNENYNGGLQITSTGAIMISSLTASNNVHGFGAILNNTASNETKPQQISITGINHVSANYGDGLTITSYGAITISNLTASSNGANDGSGYGALLNNCNVIEGVDDEPDHCATITPQAIFLTGRNSFSSNRGDGLQVFSPGAIKLNNISASFNNGTGATLNNDFPGAVSGISVTGTANAFSFNENGLDVTSRRAISISNLEASFNMGFGVDLSNYLNSPSPQNVFMGGYALLEGNENGYGLSVRTLGSISISNLDAFNNGAQGAILDNAEPAATGVITLTGVQVISGNGANGLEITSSRTVTITNLAAGLNSGYGASIDNTAFNQAFDVKITGINTFNENDLTGLDVHTYGGITLSSVTANGNGIAAIEGSGHGVNLENNANVLFAKPIILTGVNTFNENFEDGLNAISRGPIQASSLTAMSNSGNGVEFDNHLGANTAGVTLTGVSTFSGNTGLGLNVISRGLISTFNLTANLNLNGGVQLDNSQSDMARDVVVSGINTFMENGQQETGTGSGLVVKSQGRITLNNVTANGNASNGAWLSNIDSTMGTPTVTVTGPSFFTANRSTGLFVLSAGDVSLTKVVSDNNLGDGLVTISLRNISLSCASLTSNAGTGLWASASFGTVTLKGVFAYGNEVNIGLFALKVVESRSC